MKFGKQFVRVMFLAYLQDSVSDQARLVPKSTIGSAIDIFKCCIESLLVVQWQLSLAIKSPYT
jgi:hypothetical protein